MRPIEKMKLECEDYLQSQGMTIRATQGHVARTFARDVLDLLDAKAWEEKFEALSVAEAKSIERLEVIVEAAEKMAEAGKILLAKWNDVGNYLYEDDWKAARAALAAFDAAKGGTTP